MQVQSCSLGAGGSGEDVASQDLEDTAGQDSRAVLVGV